MRGIYPPRGCVVSGFIRERDANSDYVTAALMAVIKQSAGDAEDHLTDDELLNTMMGGLSVPAMRPHHCSAQYLLGSLLSGRWSPVPPPLLHALCSGKEHGCPLGSSPSARHG